MATYKGSYDLAEEVRRNKVIPERTQTLVSMGIPVLAARVLASKPGVGYAGLPILANLAKDYKIASSKGLLERVAAIVAVSEGEFRSERDGLDRVVSSYRTLVNEGFSEWEAITRAIF